MAVSHWVLASLVPLPHLYSPKLADAPCPLSTPMGNCGPALPSLPAGRENAQISPFAWPVQTMPHSSNTAMPLQAQGGGAATGTAE